MLELNKLYNMDCMEGMREFPDKYFELAIVDPPYGIKRLSHPKGRLEKYGDTRKANDNVPTQEYFNELKRVSKNQIIWGGNYFELPPCRGIIFWDKGVYGKTNYSDGEIAWTSFDNPLRVAQIRYDGFLGQDEDGRIHPTQKPVALYSWLLQKYAKPGDKIIDTHVGSASSLIACHRHGVDFIGFEIDRDYYAAANERLAAEMAQVRFEYYESQIKMQE